jgi:hypothetical protein
VVRLHSVEHPVYPHNTQIRIRGGCG